MVNPLNFLPIKLMAPSGLTLPKIPSYIYFSSTVRTMYELTVHYDDNDISVTPCLKGGKYCSYRRSQSIRQFSVRTALVHAYTH